MQQSKSDGAEHWLTLQVVPWSETTRRIASSFHELMKGNGYEVRDSLTI